MLLSSFVLFLRFYFYEYGCFACMGIMYTTGVLGACGGQTRVALNHQAISLQPCAGHLDNQVETLKTPSFERSQESESSSSSSLVHCPLPEQNAPGLALDKEMRPVQFTVLEADTPNSKAPALTRGFQRDHKAKNQSVGRDRCYSFITTHSGKNWCPGDLH